MSIVKNKLLIISLLVLFNFTANFLLFTYSYNKLATPFLHEEQRVENADFIMSTTAGLFALEALLLGAIFYLVLKWHKR